VRAGKLPPNRRTLNNCGTLLPMTDRDSEGQELDPYAYARSLGPNLYNEFEFVFDHIDPSAFISSASDSEQVDFTSLPQKTQEVILYATQLAIGTHRPNFVRELEDAAEDLYIQRQTANRKQRLQDKYGTNALNETVQMGGYTWSMDMADSFIETLDRLANLPVIDSKSFEGTLPEQYRQPDGTHVWNVDEKMFSQITYLINNPEPYHPHNGYRLSIEHEHLAAACIGDTDGIELWDLSGPFTPEHYKERYEMFFGPELFFDEAQKQLMIKPAAVTEVGRRIAFTAINSVLELFGEETRGRHASHTKAQSTDGPTDIVQLDLRKVQEETDAQTDFQNIKPEDFL
jgi:hypothetical protein